MKTFPKIKHVKWLSEETPDIIVVKISLQDRKQKELGIPGMDIEEIEVDDYIDLSKVYSVRAWHPSESDDVSPTECLVYIGSNDYVINVPLQNMLEAWIFYKTYNK